MHMKKSNNGMRGAALVLAAFAVVIVIIYIFFIMKDPDLHSGDTGGNSEMASLTPEESTPVPATQEPETLSATPQPGLSRQVAELSVAESADVIFVAAATGEEAKCDFYAFQKDGGRWTVALETSGFIGREGINYGERHENDYTTPGGIFSLGECFGILPAPGKMTLAYTKVDNDCYWDGDNNSETYNQMVRKSQMSDDWDDEVSEHLTDYIEQYKYCMNIEFNTSPAVPGRGFAIFLHCTKAGMVQTAGCIAIPDEDMIRCLEMATKNTYIVILKDIGDLENIEK